MTLLAMPASAHAVTVAVTTNADSGAGSLRAAVAAVNASPDASNTIDFTKPLTGGDTITLLTPLGDITKTVDVNGCSGVPIFTAPCVGLRDGADISLGLPFTAQADVSGMAVTGFVRAFDFKSTADNSTLGNADATPASYTWTVDNVRPRPAVRMASARLDTRGRVTLTVACPRETLCRGTLVLQTRTRRPVRLGRASFTARNGRCVRVRIQLGRSARARIPARGRGSLPAAARVSVRDRAGNSGGGRRNVALRR